MGLQLVNKEEITALWTKIKKNFAMVGQNAVTSGSLMYFDSAKLGPDSKTVSTLGLPASNVRDNSVLGITSGLPAWKTISSSLAFSETTANQPKLKVTVLGTDSSLYSVPLAGASASGFVSQTEQQFAGKKIFNGGIQLPNNVGVYLVDYSGSAIKTIYLGANNYFHVGWNIAKAGYNTVISGQSIELRYGGNSNTDPSSGLFLSNEGNVGIGTTSPSAKLHVIGGITARNNIQSTQGGVAAMGLADLTTSGGGGGSGTVKEIYIGSTLYPTDVDGKVTLPDYPVFSSLSTNIANSYAVSATMGGVTKNITVSDMRTVLGLGGTPDTEGGVAILGTGAKIKLSQIPDFILGQVLYGGTVNASGVATLSTNVKSKLGITSNTVTLANEAGTSSTYGWVRFEGVYFIMSADSTFASLGLKVGDWLISTGTSWQKIDNTDAVTGVKGDTENSYRTGNVNITKANIGLGSVENTALSTWAGTSNITTLGTISTGTWHGTAIENSYIKSTVIGQLLVGNGTTMNLLAKGSNGQYLKTGSSTLEWATFPTPTATWNESTSSNPTLTITDVGGSVTSATIPAARKETVNNTDTYYSGIVTTDAQTFGGEKTFDSIVNVKGYNNIALRLGSSEAKAALYMYSSKIGDTPGTLAHVLGFSAGSGDNLFLVGYSVPSVGGSTCIYGDTVQMAYSSSRTKGFILDNSGNVGIGTGFNPDTPTLPDAKLHVKGTTHFTGAATLDSILSVGSTLTVTGTSTFNGNIMLANDTSIGWKNSGGTNRANLLSYNTGNNFVIGYSQNTVGPTLIYGKSLELRTNGNTSRLTISDAGAAQFSGTLGVTGATTLSSTLDVSGLTTIANKVKVSGVSNTALELGTSTRKSGIYLWSSSSIQGQDASLCNILTFSAGTSGTVNDDWLLIGFDTPRLMSETRLYGYKVALYSGWDGSYASRNAVLDENGNMTVTRNIQSTGGGVAAMGIGDLTTGGSGGGSGTVKTMTVNSNTNKIEADTDGNVKLYVALASDSTNAIQFTVGDYTDISTRVAVNISASTLKTSLGLGAAAYKNVGSVASGNTGLVEGGAVYSNTISAIGTSGNFLTYTKGGSTSNITVPYATNAGKVDGVEKGYFYKYAGAAPMASTADTQDKPWYCVAEYSASNASDVVQSVISFYVFGRYDATSCGILNVKVRFNPSATQPYLLAAEWSAASNITPSDFVAAWKVDNGAVTVKLYTRLVGWQYYSFRKINEQFWGYPQDVWTCRRAIYASDYSFASIPSGETQVESTIIGIDNTAANATKLNNQSASYYAAASSLDSYLLLSGGTMSGIINRNFPSAETSRYYDIIMTPVEGRTGRQASFGYHNNGDTDGAFILVPYAKVYAENQGPWIKNDGLYISKTSLLYNGNTVWRSDNANLEVTRDSQQEPTGFEFAMGAESIGVSTVGVDYINSLS